MSIGNYFDLITGASIGGIIALGLANGKTARELEKSFHEQAPVIFPATSCRLWSFFRTLFSHKYNEQNLTNAVDKILGGNSTIGDLKRRVIIPTVNVTTGAPVFIKTPCKKHC